MEDGSLAAGITPHTTPTPGLATISACPNLPSLPFQYRKAYKELEAENRHLKEKLGML